MANKIELSSERQALGYPNCGLYCMIDCTTVNPTASARLMANLGHVIHVWFKPEDDLPQNTIVLTILHVQIIKMP